MTLGSGDTPTCVYCFNTSLCFSAGRWEREGGLMCVHCNIERIKCTRLLSLFCCESAYRSVVETTNFNTDLVDL